MQREPVNRRTVAGRKGWVQRRREHSALKDAVHVQGAASENTKRLIAAALTSFERRMAARRP